MAIYAFDGTGNEDKPGRDEDTNVLAFYEAYKRAHPDPDNCFYVPGVGTRYSIIGAIFGGAFGAGGGERIEEAWEKLQRNVEAGDTTIDIIGFSRGAALALEFANEIHDEWESSDPREIRFLGIWDTVGSFGLPGNNVNLGYNLTVPKNVTACCHAIALDERRRSFPLTRVVQDKFSDRDLLDIHEVWFRGYHSDVGGGNKNPGLSNIALYWMYRQAAGRGLVLDDGRVDEAKRGRDPSADCKTPGMDRIANKKRTIREIDAVHQSVTRRARAGRFEANNPPRGLTVVDDQGMAVGRFEED